MIFIDVIRKGTKKLVASGYVDERQWPQWIEQDLRRIYNPKKHRFEKVKR